MPWIFLICPLIFATWLVFRDISSSTTLDFRANCINGSSDYSRICWIYAGSHLMKWEGIVSGGNDMPEQMRKLAKDFCGYVAVWFKMKERCLTRLQG